MKKHPKKKKDLSIFGGVLENDFFPHELVERFFGYGYFLKLHEPNMYPTKLMIWVYFDDFVINRIEREKGKGLSRVGGVWRVWWW